MILAYRLIGGDNLPLADGYRRRGTVLRDGTYGFYAIVSRFALGEGESFLGVRMSCCCTGYLRRRVHTVEIVAEF